MAKRNIRFAGDELLRKKSRPVDEINERILTLIKDMFETMYDSYGVGLAAPQVGILRRIFVVDTGDNPLVFINPEILETEGSQIDVEGCLSFPNRQEMVERPFKVKVKALNEKGEEFTLEAEELLARAILHENDHLNGVLFVDKIKK
ncbi:peptide deformylase [Clostridium sp. 'White wine YQ']|uniref:peptide deformylase n=1 Tax=Clostridium sp. 'White wine YQ' TaxID=3027474 RepID=UPI00236626DD|nr:peptide deformylase [Clostridium sp. 'White wine YQ']MDD7793739.1 peptide deformylase [Clostridium sp. 'White wine YQ']